MRNRVGELLRSNKREYFNDRRTRFLNSPIRFSNELIRHTDSQKKNGKLHIRGNENKLNTNDFAVPTCSMRSSFR